MYDTNFLFGNSKFAFEVQLHKFIFYAAFFI